MREVLKSQLHLDVLVIDDDKSLGQSVKLNLELYNFKVVVAENVETAKTVLETSNVSIVICDNKLSKSSGLRFIEENSKNYKNKYFILTSGDRDPSLIIEAVKVGAYETISKPFEAEDLVLLCKKIEQKIIQQSSSPGENIAAVFMDTIASSEVMQEIFDTVTRLANYDTTVLITGESGTGKELIAKAIHSSSTRNKGPFIPINCGAIPENLIESELFGHKKGAFTDATRDKIGLLEQAEGGTIFLDEIGELPTHLQVKLLRALQARQIQAVGDEHIKDINIRIIAATLKNLDEEVELGNFREDLYYRLNVVAIKIPPLRERKEDLDILINYFLNKFNKKLACKIKGFTENATAKLKEYHWPGNVRELENCVERCMVLCESEFIDVKDLPDNIIKSATLSLAKTIAGSTQNYDTLSIKVHTENLERNLINQALTQTKGNRTHAAKLLDISHRALLYKIKEYNVT